MKVYRTHGLLALLRAWASLVQALTPKRFFNLTRLGLGIIFSPSPKWSFHAGFPFAVAIEPTTACNLHCPECPTGSKTLKRKPGNLDINDFRNLVNKLPDETFYLTLYFQGEPMLNKHFFSMAEYAKQRKMFVVTSTNGHYLDDENVERLLRSGLDKIIISLDGANAESYSAYRRGGNIEKVISGIATLVKRKRETGKLHPFIVVQFIVFRQNQHQVNEIKQLAMLLGVDALELKTAQHYGFKEENPYMTTLDKYTRYRRSAQGSFAPKNKMKNRCRRMLTSCVITWDGNLVPCCYDKDAEFCFGNLFRSGFHEIWNGAAAENFRRRVMQSRKDLSICRNCTE